MAEGPHEQDKKCERQLRHVLIVCVPLSVDVSVTMKDAAENVMVSEHSITLDNTR